MGSWTTIFIFVSRPPNEDLRSSEKIQTEIGYEIKLVSVSITDAGRTPLFVFADVRLSHAQDRSVKVGGAWL